MPRVHDPALISAIGRRLRELREARGMAQERLAELIDVEPVTLSRAEHGRRALSVSNLARAAQALRVPLSALFEFDVPLTGPALAAEPAVEHELLVVFRRLSASHQGAMVGIGLELARSEEPSRSRVGTSGADVELEEP